MSFYPRLNEISNNVIKPYVASGNASILIDPTIDDEIRRVEDKRRSDKITQEYVDSAATKLKKYLL